ncbi:hypothetical protein [Mesorhizobium sp. YM1C-6-2]|uniref:hypothetical protein n=1 Tax=Mesorhizobium sp. YM1C-6-2 TaxID=1827501 RepID=UPI000EF1DFAE|nr:hypothetical protein [Mesorhizobium sp. YM1C-6-2]RLP21867.1 hypothetical protein D8676_26695 [Mesorhizobium sp. YM1C-6-2]
MPDSTQTNREDDLSKEVDQLKREIANLRSAIAERADDLVQGASRAAGAVAQPIRNNPGTAGLLFGTLLGLLAGMAIAQMSEQRPRHWYDRYR